MINQDRIKKIVVQLGNVSTLDQFEDWVRLRMRDVLPHAALLGMFGKLYGAGSVPTHRMGVDFPLNLAEEMKDKFGAIDDPYVCEWFSSGKPKFIELPRLNSREVLDHSQKTFRKYGIQNLATFGVLNHESRRFALFQMCNLRRNDRFMLAKELGELALPMAEVGWRVFDSRAGSSLHRVVGHPTVALTVTEIEIIQALSQGLSNKEIARRRGVSSSTIKTQVSRTGAKLGATRRAEIVAVGMSMLCSLPSQGLISYDE